MEPRHFSWDVDPTNTMDYDTYRMCPPVELMQYYQMDPMKQPTHFMSGTATKVWGDDTFKVMRTSAADWDSNNNDDSP